MGVRLGTRAICAFSLVAAGAAAPARAQDEPPPPPPAPRGASNAQTSAQKPIDPTSPDFRGAVLGDLSDQRIIGGERVVTAVGGVGQPVWIKLPGFEIRCDSAVVWGDRERLDASLQERRAKSPDDPADLLGGVLHAVYAEGHVFVTRESYSFHADRVLIDFTTHHAYIVDALLQGSAKLSKGREAPLSIRAKVVRGIAENRFRAEGATLTSCTYAHPHLAFETDTVEVDYTDEDPAFETGWWPTVRADTVFGKDVPLLPIPKLGGGLGGYPVQTFEFSNSTRFGTTLGIGFGGKLKRDDGSTWGDWQLTPRYRTRRGAGLGVSVDHNGQSGPGEPPAERLEFDAEWQHDTRGTDAYSSRDYVGETGSSSDAERGRMKLWYRLPLESGLGPGHLSEGWRLDVSGDWYSDRGYLPEYHPQEVLEDPLVENSLYLRRTWGSQGVAILGSYRLNDEAASLVRTQNDPYLTTYEVQTENLPSVTWHVLNAPVVSPKSPGGIPLNFSSEVSLANSERRADEVLADRLARGGWRSVDVRRGDVETRLTAPFEVGPVNITPAVGASAYFVSAANGFGTSGTDDGGDSEDRNVGFFSLRVGTEAHRNFDVQNSALDLDGLRHVASLDALWFDRFHVSDGGPDSFQQNDLRDSLTELNTLSLRLRNRLQTQREGETCDWIDYETRFLYYFQEADATSGSAFGVREDFASPLDRIDSPGEEKYLARNRDGSAFHQHRARIELTPEIWLVGEADYDMTASYMETAAAGVRWAPNKQFSIYAGRRTIHDDSAIWTVRADYRLSDKWGFTTDFQTDTKNNQGLRTTVGLYRRSHDFTIAMEFESERLLEQTGVSFVIYPHDWVVRKSDPFSKRRALDYDALRWYR